MVNHSNKIHNLSDINLIGSNRKCDGDFDAVKRSLIDNGKAIDTNEFLDRTWWRKRIKATHPYWDKMQLIVIKIKKS